jgi:hypothetical protein
MIKLENGEWNGLKEVSRSNRLVKSFFLLILSILFIYSLFQLVRNSSNKKRLKIGGIFDYNNELK